MKWTDIANAYDGSPMFALPRRLDPMAEALDAYRDWHAGRCKIGELRECLGVSRDEARQLEAVGWGRFAAWRTQALALFDGLVAADRKLAVLEQTAMRLQAEANAADDPVLSAELRRQAAAAWKERNRLLKHIRAVVAHRGAHDPDRQQGREP